MTKSTKMLQEIENEPLKSFHESSGIYALFDVKKGIFGQLFEAMSDDHARRMFITLLTTNQRSDITDFPQDFSLYHFGYFDNSLGEFMMNSQPIQLMTGLYAKHLANDLMKGRLEDVVGQQDSDVSENTDSI